MQEPHIGRPHPLQALLLVQVHDGHHPFVATIQRAGPYIKNLKMRASLPLTFTAQAVLLRDFMCKRLTSSVHDSPINRT